MTSDAYLPCRYIIHSVSDGASGKVDFKVVDMPGRIASYALGLNLKQVILIATAAIVEILLLGVEAQVPFRSCAELLCQSLIKSPNLED
jgi:hypothetical protein